MDSSEERVAALDDKRHDPEKSMDDSDRRPSAIVTAGEIVNASGHRDQLQRQYNLLSICGLALTIDNAWVALAGSIAISINNGGPAGVLYELLVACFYYGFIAASIAELASSIPSAGGVYHWASVTPGPRYGRVLGFFTGALNFFGWIFDLASIISIPANIAVQMYAVFHPDLTIQAWHIYIAFILITWFCCTVVIFGNRFLPLLNDIGLFLIIVGGLVTIIVVAAMPKVHASNSAVWGDFSQNNAAGWSDGVTFLTGVLNGAFTIGTPDAVTHMSEELPNPAKDMPKAVAAQMILGTLTSFFYAVAILYGITDISAVVGSNGSFPLAVVYSQATGSKGATFGLLLILFLSIMICVLGTFLTVGRIWWALARDNATPFAGFFSIVNERLSCPVPATILCAVLATAFGAIQLGSKTAFTDLVGSFIILTTTSYALAIGSHLVTGRKNVPKGPFWMGSAGFAINGIAVLLVIFFNIMFCFPYVYPATKSTMNYNSVILVGVVVLATMWWFIHARRNYPGPKLSHLYVEGKIVELPREKDEHTE
ncbi:hypothetical protein OEA41_004964 [Lepraria neglecta]|uniref:Choline transport protein n=1 Tax=Lepraria neglecta TaxID=209136 RepID=A0AAD9Z062_9LECA|nr:hypothetical protein OEA41_004964 [Lepraria neglecta]